MTRSFLTGSLLVKPFSDMVSVAACHAGGRGSNPGGPKAFSLYGDEVIWLVYFVAWIGLGEVETGYIHVLHCMDYISFMPDSAPTVVKGEERCHKTIPNSLAVGLTL